jgi:PP-loop superfamily ATP-utilizing enzyme
MFRVKSRLDGIVRYYRAAIAQTVIVLLLAMTGVVLDGGAVLSQTHDATARDVVVRLYRDYAWEAVMSGTVRDGFFADQPLVELEKYLDHELASLLVADAECIRRTHEICNLEFMPLFASQDPAASDLEVEETKKKDEVQVTFKRLGGDQVRMLFKMRQEVAGWRISDIEYESSRSLKTILKAK